MLLDPLKKLRFSAHRLAQMEATGSTKLLVGRLVPCRVAVLITDAAQMVGVVLEVGDAGIRIMPVLGFMRSTGTE